MVFIKETVGTRYGRLVVIDAVPKLLMRKSGREGPKRKAYWLCRCDCGVEGLFRGTRIRSGETKSCGCLMRESQIKNMTSGRGNALPMDDGSLRSYRSWTMMLYRCYEKKCVHYDDYGGRGITVCERWRASFENFIADMGKREKGMSIGRINNDGNYESSNCRWENRTQQANNRRTTVKIVVKGEEVVLAEYCKANGLNRNVVYGRIKKGWTVEDALDMSKGYKKTSPSV